jgi:hypothetical protein
MQRQGFGRLYDWFVSFQRTASKRKSAQGNMTETSASPILVFVADALFLLLAILVIDLHRDELRALGFIFGDEGIVPFLAGP